MIDNYVIGGTVRSKKKSHFWPWFFVVVLMLVVAVYAGWHYGIDDKLKITADLRAVDSHPVPIAVPPASEGTTNHLFWRDETFEDGLRCRLFKKKGTGATPDFTHPDTVSCDWTTYPRR